jgi:hypothetical protein
VQRVSWTEVEVQVRISDNTYMLVKIWQDIKGPHHSREGVEKALFGKRLAATLSTSPTERIHAILVRVRLFRTAFALEKSLWHEPVWIGKVAWMPVDSPHVTSKVSASWEVVALVIEVDGISMRNAS